MKLYFLLRFLISYFMCVCDSCECGMSISQCRGKEDNFEELSLLPCNLGTELRSYSSGGTFTLSCAARHNTHFSEPAKSETSLLENKLFLYCFPKNQGLFLFFLDMPFLQQERKVDGTFGDNWEEFTFVYFSVLAFYSGLKSQPSY